MRIVSRSLRGIGLLTIVCGLVAFSGTSVAVPLSLPNIPVFLPASVPPLNMLVMGRDHKLYYEAYNDYTDLDGDDKVNGDTKIDVRFKPTISYFGYFDSKTCYSYSSANKRFEPSSDAGTLTTCSGNWSGNFLNYVTTSRIDALRKVLYGGYRSTDTESETVLERSFIPQDAHSWGKEYTSVAVDGYDISKYTPLAIPTSGRHLFANTTVLPSGTSKGTEPTIGPPLLRVLQNRSERIWNWVSTERAVAGKCLMNGQNGDGSCKSGSTAVVPEDRVVRVLVCVDGKTEQKSCQPYPNGKYKPTGLLQEFGANDSMYFGLLTGSYAKNTSGGVLRREMSSISEELDSKTGIFYNGVKKKGDSTVTADKGIITTLNRLRVTQFVGDFEYACGFGAAARPIKEGECQMWGNPIGEMMYESARYFAGKGSPTSAFSVSYGSGEEQFLTGKGLPVASWDNPYASPRPVCAKPFQTVISDINPSYDSDGVPGSAFASTSGDLDGLDAKGLGDSMWKTEFGGAQNIFIGEVKGSTDGTGAPSAKSVSSFGDIRGLSPEEPTKQGSYSSSAVAYFAHKTDLNPAQGDQKVTTFSVALASPLPKISIPIGTKTITLVPFAKSVAGSSIDAAGTFQPTDQIVDFYVDTLTDTHGIFRVNFEDVEQGADHDMDAITVYEYTVKDGKLEVHLKSEYAYGGITQHMGYVISGTDGQDGTYLEVLDQRSGDVAGDTDYKLDTPDSFDGKSFPVPEAKWKDGKALPFEHTRTFSPGSTSGASILKDPLWYAAKWGGYDEAFEAPADRNDIPDKKAEWDEDNNGTPDNYFLVTNALKLSQQLRHAFEDILKKTTAASAASINSGSVSSDTRIFAAKFNTGEWTGQLLAYGLNDDGSLSTLKWDASDKLPAFGSRSIITTNTDGTPVAFRWGSLDNLPTIGRQTLIGSEDILNYLRGDSGKEGTGDSQFRERPKKLGDIVSSSPMYVAAPPFRYPSTVESAPYSKFATDNSSREPMVYVGANDGMLHGFNVASGVEKFAFIPAAVIPNLKNLTSQGYSHQYYVDGAPTMGDVFVKGAWRTALVGGLNKGGQEIYALNITDPTKLAGAESDPASVVMWEFRDVDTNPDPAVANGDPDLGLTYSQPTIAKLRNGKWAAVFGNGYNSMTGDGSASTTGNAVLYIVDMETGNLIRKLDTGVGSAKPPTGVTYDNGLSTPTLVDLNGDRVAESAYAGDLYGNMWKFDLSSTDSNQWKVAYSDAGALKPLFTAVDGSGNSQPITDRPAIARGPAGQGVVVLFGTGKYLEPDDKLLTPVRVQSFYGIFDKNVGSSDRVTAARSTALKEQTILAEASVTKGGTPINVRVTSDTAIGDKQGWFIDLKSPSGYQAEKQVSNPVVRNGHVLFTTLIPDGNPCNFGGGSWIMEMNVFDGKRVEKSSYDLNHDGVFNSADNVTVTIDGKAVTVPITGLGSTQGILQSPGTSDGPVKDPDGATHEVQHVYLLGSKGEIQQFDRDPGLGASGRQSWRQVR
jgi:type IV pilus assembly protein PilY1